LPYYKLFGNTSLATAPEKGLITFDPVSDVVIAFFPRDLGIIESRK
jgi:hypothetical protein